MSVPFPKNLNDYKPIPFGGLYILSGLVLFALILGSGVASWRAGGAESTTEVFLGIFGAIQLSLVFGVFIYFLTHVPSIGKTDRWPFPWLTKWWARHQYYLVYQHCRHGELSVHLRRFGQKYRGQSFSTKILSTCENALCTVPDLELIVPLGGIFRHPGSWVELRANREEAKGTYPSFYSWSFGVASLEQRAGVIEIHIRATDPNKNSFSMTVRELFNLFTLALNNRPTHRDSYLLTWERIFKLQRERAGQLESQVRQLGQIDQYLRADLVAATEAREAAVADATVTGVNTRRWQKLFESCFDMFYKALEDIRSKPRVANPQEGALVQISIITCLLELLDLIQEFDQEHQVLSKREELVPMLDQMQHRLGRLKADARRRDRKKKAAAAG